MNIKLIEKLQRKSKEYGIYLVRRMDSNLKGQQHSYCISFKKRGDRSFADAVKGFDEYLKGFVPDGARIEYANKMFVVHMDDNIYYFCLEAYKKNSDSRGYMEEGNQHTEFLRRMGVEQAVRRIKKYSYQYWLKNHDWVGPDTAIEEIKSRMTDPELVERYPNHADRFIASYNLWKDQRMRESHFVKGIL